MPEWPPANYSYTELLREVGFREVDAAKFKIEPEFGKSFSMIDGFFRWKPVQKSDTARELPRRF